MKTAEIRIADAIALIETKIEATLKEKVALQHQIAQLTQENTRLKKTVESVISRVDGYLIELENIRRDHGSSNNSN